jgi:Avidin family
MGSDPLAGVWYSTVGSKLELKIQDSVLTGSFESTENSGGKFEIHGTVDPDLEMPDRALSFSVCWIDGRSKSKYRSVSSYTGQFHRTDSDAIIETIFLLVDATSINKQFVSTFVGYDNFYREQPQSDKVRKR